MAKYSNELPQLLAVPHEEAFGGAVVGTLLGAVIGAVVTTYRWEEVPLNQFRVSVVPQRDGRFGLGLSVRF